MGNYIREFSVSQFNKRHSTPKDNDNDRITRTPKCVSAWNGTSKGNQYKPRRRYRKLESISKLIKKQEFQQCYWSLVGSTGFSKELRGKEKEQAEKKKAAAAAIPGRVKSELASEEDEYVVEQKRLISLLKGISIMEGKEGALSSSTVGSIVGLQSEEISQIASEYAEPECHKNEVFLCKLKTL
ncbi:coiled-coil domain-containing protein 93-like [Montipora capricornis]|uniref:coiled-coil domain-containing protein 93-like n=1 Tax=Montipora capricornis TaxID=246305 RepID=UPI0035F15740